MDTKNILLRDEATGLLLLADSYGGGAVSNDGDINFGHIYDLDCTAAQDAGKMPDIARYYWAKQSKSRYYTEPHIRAARPDASDGTFRPLKRFVVSCATTNPHWDHSAAPLEGDTMEEAFLLFARYLANDPLLPCRAIAFPGGIANADDEDEI